MSRIQDMEETMAEKQTAEKRNKEADMDSLPPFRHTLIVIVVYQYSVLRDVVQLGPNIIP